MQNDTTRNKWETKGTKHGHKGGQGETRGDEGRQGQTRGDKGRQDPREGGHTIQHRHTCGETVGDKERQDLREGHTIQHRRTCGETVPWETVGDKGKKNFVRCQRPQTDAAPKRAPKGANHTNPPPHKGKWPATKQNSLRCISRTRVINLPHPRLHLHQPRLNLINVRNKSDLPTIPRSQLMRRPTRQQFNSRAVTAGPSTMIPGPPVPTRNG